MPISDAHSAIFIHIPKTGGTSIEKALGVFGGHSTTRLFGREMQHYTSREVRELFPEKWADYYKFSVVRDPVKRLVSEYKRRMEVHNIDSDFDAFCLYTLQNLDHMVGHFHAHLRPQSDYLSEEVDFVGRLEELGDNWRVLKGQLQIDEDLPHSNASAPRQVLISAQSIDLINAVYQPDYDRFAYPKHAATDYQGYAFLDEIKARSQSIADARKFGFELFEARRVFEVALLGDAVRRQHPDHPFGWSIGIKACVQMRTDVGNGKRLVGESLGRFENKFLLHQAHTLLKISDGPKRAIEVSSRLLEMGASDEPVHVKVVRDACDIRRDFDSDLRESVRFLEHSKEKSRTSCLALRQHYWVEGDLEKVSECSRHMCDTWDIAEDKRLAVLDISQLPLDHPAWDWLEQTLKIWDVSADTRQEVSAAMAQIRLEDDVLRRPVKPLETPPHVGEQTFDDPDAPIHLLWMPSPSRAPALVELCIDQWRKLNPDRTVLIHDQNAVLRMLPKDLNIDIRSRAQFPAISRIFQAMVLSQVGGIWADPTVFPSRPLEAMTGWVQGENCFFLPDFRPGVSHSNWFAVVSKDGPEIRSLVSRIQREFRSDKTSKIARNFPEQAWSDMVDAAVFQAGTRSEAKLGGSDWHGYRLQYYLKRTPSPDEKEVQRVLDAFPLHKLCKNIEDYHGFWKIRPFLKYYSPAVLNK
jgi:hypothetical protein